MTTEEELVLPRAAVHADSEYPSVVYGPEEETLAQRQREAARRAAFLYRPELVQASLRPTHPLKLDRPQRLRALLAAYGLLDRTGLQEVVPEPVSIELVRAIHSDAYIEIVQQLSRGEPVPAHVQGRHGFSDFGDNQPFPGMFAFYCLVAGATLKAVPPFD